MTTPDWVLQALEQIGDVGMGDDPVEGLTDDQVGQLEAKGLIRLQVVRKRIPELGSDQPLVQPERTVSITSAGRRLIDDV